MPEKEIYHGRWWLASELPSTAVYGALSIEFDGTLELTLVGGFDIWVPDEVQEAHGVVSSSRQHSSYQLIFGEAAGERLTLLNNLIGRSPLMAGSGTQTLYPQRALRGRSHLEALDASIVDAVYLRVEYLTFFCQLSGFAFEDFSRTSGGMSSQASYTPTDDLRVEYGNAIVELGLEFNDFFPDKNNQDGDKLGATERAYFYVTFKQPVTLSTADELAKRLQDLITLATNRPCAALDRRYRLTNAQPNNDPEEDLPGNMDPLNTYGYGRQIYRPSEVRNRDIRSDFLFTLLDLPFEQVVPRWLDIYDKVTTGIQMFVGTRYLNVGFVSSRLINIAAALESIHTGLYDRPAIPELAYKEILASLMKAVPNSSDRKFLRERVNNRMSYKQRALDLAARLPDDSAQVLLTDSEEWAKRLRDSRNYVAHALDNRRQDPVPGLDLLLMLITQCLLHIVLAMELGLDASKVNQFVQRSWGLSSRFEEVLLDAKRRGSSS